ncbi:PREDICTED: transmembrane protein 165-like isoform X2 [Branchiostoma belcheri]|uniref:GDT1 family protein n=1 Tax=Branchiostoma belcheri TaxID=7741 RepID=A0A6P4YLB4_BRABE|nr:PREDICTED: transmembrane protein 165-like isoform X2 [Branchiostoma belcheri]
MSQIRVGRGFALPPSSPAPMAFRRLLSLVLSQQVLFLVVMLAAIAHVAGEKMPFDIEDQEQEKAIQDIQKREVASTVALSKDAGMMNAEQDSIVGSYTKGANLGFIHAFIASLSVIIVSELGDKTFFIAAIMAMRYSRVTVFVGALGALAVMTILSALMGFATMIIPRVYTYYISTGLFVIFGLKMLKEGYYMEEDEAQEEFEEVQRELKQKDEEMEMESRTPVTQDAESGVIRGGSWRRVWGIFSPIFLQSFVMTFLAEWGDRSQITTIILAAREDVLGVTIGGILGHALCTGLAVIGGRMIAQRISVRTVTLVGGVVFLIFALSAFFIGQEEE